MSGPISAGEWLPFVGAHFDLVGHDVSIELVVVDEAESASGSFALLFEGPTDAELWQDTWQLRVGDQTFNLFLVPIGPRGSGRLGYESVFSLIPTATA